MGTQKKILATMPMREIEVANMKKRNWETKPIAKENANGMKLPRYKTAMMGNLHQTASH